jgi:hypothetical protein
MNFFDLNVLLQPDGSMEFDVYWKPTHTDQYIPWDIDQPLHHKGSIVHALTSSPQVQNVKLPNSAESRRFWR